MKQWRLLAVSFNRMLPLKTEFTPIRPELFTLVSGKAVWGTDVARWSGQTMRDMKASGSSTRHAAKENSFIPTVIFMMAHGLITKQMDTEFTRTWRELVTKATGKTTNKMERVLKPGQKVHSTRESTWWARKKVLGNTPGPMARLMKASGKITRLMDSEPIFGKTAANILASGLTMTCRDMVSTSTQTECVTTVSTWTTKRKAMVFTTGPMEGSMKGGGTRASSTDSEHTSIALKSQ